MTEDASDTTPIQQFLPAEQAPAHERRIRVAAWGVLLGRSSRNVFSSLADGPPFIARNNSHAGIVPLNRGAVTTKKQTLSPATKPVVGNRPFLDNCLSLLQDRDAGIGVFPSDEKSW